MQMGTDKTHAKPNYVAFFKLPPANHYPLRALIRNLRKQPECTESCASIIADYNITGLEAIYQTRREVVIYQTRVKQKPQMFDKQTDGAYKR